MELELTSIDPYLENISDTKRDEVKIMLANRFFANPEIKDSKASKYYPFIIKNLFKLLDNGIKRDSEIKIVKVSKRSLDGAQRNQGIYFLDVTTFHQGYIYYLQMSRLSVGRINHINKAATLVTMPIFKNTFP